ncbi:DUF2254 domain-containing protein [Nodosilinea sp. E11]|uniref:DUF2254 domain-containing protein n=1 Tax=Nodosilinea sp. E11 TaxID=3037479 RepID=UPI0029344E97|nr:DUF2254 domain-containing protein [Nodosilinea sp. E11]WOD39528.1 DUF2254 domain-containing protein [Nodosilinea sp. E11]
MKYAQLDKLWDSLRSSFWFVPTLMVGLSIALSFFTIGIDHRLEADAINHVSWAYALGPSGSRAVLSAIAGSMVSVATTAFSITIVALQLASSQFGPRLLRNFMQDTGNQVVLGTFISTFVYSLMVLRTVNEVEGREFVPHVAVTCALGLAIASIGVLIYFLHHAASSIQVDHIITAVGHDLEEAIDRLFPTPFGQGQPDLTPATAVVERLADFEHSAHRVKAKTSGYIQVIDEHQLMAIATEHDLIIQVRQQPGRFVVQGCDLMRILPAESIDSSLEAQIDQTLVIGSKRTNQQELEFSITQLVEIAVRALSPGINDPFTAIRCIDQLSATLAQLAQQQMPWPYRYDEQNQLRVLTPPIAFGDITDAAFNQIRQNGRSSVAVTLRLLEAIAVIAPFTQQEADRAALRRHAQMIERGSQEAIYEPLDRQDIQTQYVATMAAIEPVEAKLNPKPGLAVSSP